MPKRATINGRPQFRLDTTLEMPLYKQLYGRLRGAILAGQLPRGERLPSTRTLASELGVSRGTTVLAYEQLLLEGYLESRVGRGTTVSRRLPAMLPRQTQTAARPDEETAQPLVEAPLQLTARARGLQAVPNLNRVEGSRGGVFRGGQPALDLFPYELWARLLARHARQSLSSFPYYQPPAGYLPLREAIAAHIGITRGVRCTPEQIILTAGTQGALDLAVRTLLEPGEEAWLENPGYFGAHGALLAGGAHLVPVPVDAEGLDIEAGRTRAPAARLAFVTPSHQYPTGVTMSLRRRLELLDWAREAGAWVLEDDYDSEYRFGGRPLEALQALDRAGRVLYLGTFSKLLFPSLRLGYLVAPRELVEPLLTTRRFTDVHLPILEQMVLADFLHEGHFARHLRRMLQHYRQRRDCLRRELQTHLADLLEVYVPQAGMELVGWLPPGKDDNRASDLAAAAGIYAAPISRFSLEPLTRGALILGYASADEEQIREGVKTLAAALQHL